MLSICSVTDQYSKALTDFKEQEWPIADILQYGKPLPSFNKYRGVLIALEDTVVVGYISFTLELGVALIESLIVGKAQRRQGIAKQLVVAMESDVQAQGAHKVLLETGANWIARHLYASLGYSLRTELKEHYNHQDFVLMDKNI